MPPAIQGRRHRALSRKDHGPRRSSPETGTSEGNAPKGPSQGAPKRRIARGSSGIISGGPVSVDRTRVPRFSSGASSMRRPIGTGSKTSCFGLSEFSSKVLLSGSPLSSSSTPVDKLTDSEERIDTESRGTRFDRGSRLPFVGLETHFRFSEFLAATLFSTQLFLVALERNFEDPKECFRTKKYVAVFERSSVTSFIRRKRTLRWKNQIRETGNGLPRSPEDAHRAENEKTSRSVGEANAEPRAVRCSASDHANGDLDPRGLSSANPHLGVEPGALAEFSVFPMPQLFRAGAQAAFSPNFQTLPSNFTRGLIGVDLATFHRTRSAPRRLTGAPDLDFLYKQSRHLVECDSRIYSTDVWLFPLTWKQILIIS
ncbi:hypothetical protein TNCT_483301 [Trichonephila clavata]|uniref:Uncharacterized protein n=1 Tax=Trichonephila clavata TaxID=2740835 RepID=A0A8X6KBG3_TRICU|nr:hypothetical protein TNCT_483301 [Trichonephila clavata]